MIDFDYSRVMRQVGELRQIADDMAIASNQKLGPAIVSVENAWIGESGQLFLEKCTAFESRVKKEIAQIRSLADYCERAANEMKNIERQAATVAADF